MAKKKNKQAKEQELALPVTSLPIDSESRPAGSDERAPLIASPLSPANHCPRCRHTSSAKAVKLGGWHIVHAQGYFGGKHFTAMKCQRIICEKCRQIHVIKEYSYDSEVTIHTGDDPEVTGVSVDKRADHDN